MKKVISISLIFLLIIAQVFTFVGCGKSKAETSFGEDWLLNTYCYIKTFNPGEEEVISEAFKLARDYENRLSKTVPSSLVARFNDAGEDTGFNIFDENNNDLVTLFIMSSVLNQISEAKFDISVGNLTDLWDFTSGKGTVPNKNEIEKALELTGFDKLFVTNDGEIHKLDKNIKIDFGAIAKGYIADQVAEFLRSKGVSSAIISLGGNIICLGEKPDLSPWKIGIEKPNLATEESGKLEERESIGTVTTPNDYSVVTSGTYERYILDESVSPAKVYHHIIDPATGYSADTDLVSATIIGPASVTCDALSTCCILLGSDKAQSFMDRYNTEITGENSNYEYVLIKNDGEIIKSAGAIL